MLALLIPGLRMGGTSVATESVGGGATGAWQAWAKDYNRRREDRLKVKIITEPKVIKVPLAKPPDFILGPAHVLLLPARILLRGFSAEVVGQAFVELNKAELPIIASAATIRFRNLVLDLPIGKTTIAVMQARLAEMERRLKVMRDGYESFSALERKLQIAHEDYELLGIS